jgi:hypothetical protein
VKKLLGTITTDNVTPKNNQTTAVPFTIPKEATLLLQPDVDCYLIGSTDPATVVSATSGLRVAANATDRDRSGGYVSALAAAAGTVNLKVFAVLGERHS